MSNDRVEQLSNGMAENRPALAIVLSDVLPEAFGESLRERLAAPDLPVTVERMRMGPFAGLEVYLPSAVMLFVAAGYFNGFLQKLGEDHYGAEGRRKNAAQARVDYAGRADCQPG